MFSKHIIQLQNHIYVKLTAQYHESEVTELIILPSDNDYVVDQPFTNPEAQRRFEFKTCAISYVVGQVRHISCNNGITSSRNR
jgi:hypothetical protein